MFFLKTLQKGLFIAFFSTVLPVITYAQPDPTEDAPENDVPIDGGLSVLVGSGIAYGVMKLKKKKPQ